MGANMAAGMYSTLEQQMAAAASGMSPMMPSSGLSPPRSTDVRIHVLLFAPAHRVACAPVIAACDGRVDRITA